MFTASYECQKNFGEPSLSCNTKLVLQVMALNDSFVDF
jgi:hypothetical protein